jgi:ferritin
MKGMISAPLAELLIKQIGSELTAHQNYMAISLYFRRQSLDEWAKLFHQQALEEAQHASKILNFLIDCEVEFDLPAIGAASTKFAAAIDAVKSAQASERRVTTEFQTMARVATENQDFVGFQFLQWFLEEQVEEEAKMAKIYDLVSSGVNLFQAQPLLTQFDD